MSYLAITHNPIQSCRYKKTEVYDVRSASSGTLLGEIRWYAPWRQYTFWPSPATVWNPACLREVADECKVLTADHRRVAAERKVAAGA